MNPAIRCPSLVVSASATPPRTSLFPTLDWILAEQQNLTAVDRFSRQYAHDAHDAPPANDRFYRDLIPVATPSGQQQYAFDVDLDLCTGCKACVTGCHSLNGLDDGEVWRTVGTLHGGTADAPVHQTVTSACHHCAEPACLSGCPVKAYEKDPVTGIVKHLDDQCIGCQYCVLMCPYDAPKYNHARGIVRKCDMCSDRLSHGEAPACVQSCPNQAIRITVVERDDVRRAAIADAFLPGAPSPAATQPTTVYRNGRARGCDNIVPGDLHSPPRQHAHPPLVVMLALTQLSVGALAVHLLTRLIFGQVGGASAARALDLGNGLVALGFGGAAMGIMPLHLGRPRYAFRALLGLRTSWLSREILAFSAYMGLFTAFAASFFVPSIRAGIRDALGAATGLAGVAGVACSVMVYAATRRPHWRGAVTGVKFALSAIILGAAAVPAVSLIVSAQAAGAIAARPPAFVGSGAFGLLLAVLVASVAAKLVWERSLSTGDSSGRDSHLRAAASGAPEWKSVAQARIWLAAIGGLALPVLALLAVVISRLTASTLPLTPLILTSSAAFLACLGGELCERYLFFAAAPPSKMPGAVA